MSTVTLEVAAPEGWHQALRDAAADWPRELNLDVRRTGEGWPPTEEADESVLVRALATGGSSLNVGPLAARPGSAYATIIGATPMSTASFGTWAQRTLLGTANPAIGAVLAWTLPHDVTDLELPADARASHHARTAMRAVAGDLSSVDDVLLATSELTANALQHGGGTPRLTATRDDHSIVVALTDHRPEALPVVLPMRGAVAASGRGMAIVEAISVHWGFTVYHDRKVVWCELVAHG